MKAPIDYRVAVIVCTFMIVLITGLFFLENEKQYSSGPMPPPDRMAFYYQPDDSKEIVKNRYNYLLNHGSYRNINAQGHYKSAEANWENLGPNGASSKCNGDFPVNAGRVISFAQDYEDESLMYCGGASGGLWRSKNGGQSWEAILDDLAFPSVSIIATVRGEEGVVYAGTGSIGNNGHGGDAVRSLGLFYKSLDGGDTWEMIPLGLTNLISGISIRPSTRTSAPYVVFVSTNRGVFRGENGENFRRVLDGNFGDVCWVSENFLLGTEYNVVAAQLNGNSVYVSQEEGREGTWQRRSLPGRDRSLGVISVDASESGFHETVYANAGGAFDGSWAGVWRSDDGGVNWVKLNTPVPGAVQMNYNNCIAVDNADENIVYTGSNARNIHRSTDGGQSWENVADGIHEDIQFITPHVRNPNTVFVANDGGCFVINDARGSMQDVENLGNEFLTLAQIYHLTVNPNSNALYSGDQYYIGTQDNGIQRGPDEFKSWWQLTCCDGMDIEFRDDIHYSALVGLDAANRNRIQYPPSNVCESWSSFAEGIPAGAPWNTQLKWMEDYFIATFGNQVFIRRNSDSRWTELANFETWVDRMDGMKRNGLNDLIVVGIDDEIPVRVFNSNSFEFHEPQMPASFWRDKRITDVHIAGENDSSPVIYASLSGITGTRVIKSEDEGETWINITGDLGMDGVANARCILPDPHHEEIVYVGSDVGMFYSCDGGQSWNQYSDNLPGTPFINDLEYDAKSDKIVAATYGTGVWIGDLVAEPCEISATENLSSSDLRIYPNPGQQYVNIQLPKTINQARYQIYNNSGLPVKSGEILGRTGTISVSELNSGNYTIELKNDLVVYSKKFVKI